MQARVPPVRIVGGHSDRVHPPLVCRLVVVSDPCVQLESHGLDFVLWAQGVVQNSIRRRLQRDDPVVVALRNSHLWRDALEAFPARNLRVDVSGEHPPTQDEIWRFLVVVDHGAVLDR